MKKFKKEDLKFGDIITLRCKKKGIFINDGIDGIRLADDGILYLTNISENLTNKGTVGKAWDIMKVERYVGYTNIHHFLGKLETTEYYRLETLYERKEEILDEKEKEYLSNVIKPFKINFIRKKKTSFGRECIEISTCDVDGYHYIITFPNFIENSMYKNMKLNIMYTPKELGL